MSRKTELVNTFKEYKRKYESVQAQKVEISRSELYTPEGRADAIAKLLADFAPTVQGYHDKATEIINKGLEALAKKWRKNSTGKLTDAGYQAGLANVIKMLELGAIQEKDDLQSIVDTYKEDFSALAVIRSIIKANGIDTGVVFPVDNREKNRQLLNQLRGNVDHYINNERLKDISNTWNAFNQGLTDVSMGMDSMAEFVETRLGDDLELLN